MDNSIAIINSMFSQDAGPPIFPVELEKVLIAFPKAPIAMYDLNLDIYHAINSDINSYHLLACLLGGYTFSFPQSAFLAFNEYPFEAGQAIPLLLSLVYNPGELKDVTSIVANRFGIPVEESYELICTVEKVIESYAENLIEFKKIIINMPSPASVIPGILLGVYIRRLCKTITIIGTGNHINVPEIADLALSMNAFTLVLFPNLKKIVSELLRNNANGSNYQNNNKLDINLNKIKEYPLYYGLRIVPYESSTGCRSRCNFCSERLFWDHCGEIIDQYVEKPVDQVITEITELRSRLNVVGITFNDCLLNANIPRTIELLEALKKIGLMYSCSLRVDNLDKSVIRNLKNCGFTNVILGLETVSKNSVKIYNKGDNYYVNKAWEIIPLFYEAGIMPQLNILIGHPFESPRDVEESVIAIHEFASYLNKCGIPFYDAPVGTVCINYPSKMYFSIFTKNNFDITYHDVPSSLIKSVPENIALLVLRIPRIARNHTFDSNSTINKLEYCKEIYKLWSKDQELIIKYKISSYSKHYNFIVMEWVDNQISIYPQIKKNSAYQSNSIISKVINNILRNDKTPIAKYVEEFRGNEASLAVIILSLAMTGVIDLK